MLRNSILRAMTNIVVIYYYTIVLLCGITEAQLFGSLLPDISSLLPQSFTLIPSFPTQPINLFPTIQPHPPQSFNFFATVQPQPIQSFNFATSMETQTIQSVTATTIEIIEDVPNPDLEPGIFPTPDPRSWPVGPDWNDPRNTWTKLDGWTGERSNLVN